MVLWRKECISVAVSSTKNFPCIRYLLHFRGDGVVIVNVIGNFFVLHSVLSKNFMVFFGFSQIYGIFVPTPLVGGRNYILKWVFFVPWILADRYIHRREMCVVSLKSSSSVEFEIKKIFLNFVFFRGVIENSSFMWTLDIWFTFVHFYHNFRSN